MQIFENHSLKAFNTFRIDCKAAFFAVVTSVSELRKILAKPDFLKLPKLFLGGGSNILLCRDYEGLVILIDLKGISDLGNGLIKVQAGENWHDFVLWCLDNDLGGVENLAEATRGVDFTLNVTFIEGTGGTINSVVATHGTAEDDTVTITNSNTGFTAIGKYISGWNDVFTFCDAKTSDKEQTKTDVKQVQTTIKDGLYITVGNRAITKSDIVNEIKIILLCIIRTMKNFLT